jgi:hypothetical protein
MLLCDFAAKSSHWNSTVSRCLSQIALKFFALQPIGDGRAAFGLSIVAVVVV